MTGASLAILSGDLVTDTPDRYTPLTAAWLLSYRESRHTRDAYQRDLAEYVAWCRTHNLEPATVTRPHADAYAAWLANTAGRGGRLLSPSTVARKISAISSWYAYLHDAQACGTNPFARVRRPRVDKDNTTTVGMTVTEATELLAAARTDRWLGDACAAALAAFLVHIGARVSEVVALDVDDLSYDSGHRTVRLRMKGGKVRTRAVPPTLSAALDAYLEGRGNPADGPLFVTPFGARLTRQQVGRFVTRAAKAAGIQAWDRITPHSFRHAWATIARQAGASLETRQHALGHADPRTTQRYDRARASLDTDPSYLVAAATSQTR